MSFLQSVSRGVSEKCHRARVTDCVPEFRFEPLNPHGHRAGSARTHVLIPFVPRTVSGFCRTRVNDLRALRYVLTHEIARAHVGRARFG